YAVRGGIVDVFTPDASQPIRIDFWGDEIDTIASFEVDSQRRTDTLEEVKITPAVENSPDSTDKLVEQLEELLKSEKKITDARKQRILSDIDKLKNNIEIAYDAYLPQIYNEFCTIFNFFSGTLFASDSTRIFDRLKAVEKLAADDMTTLIEDSVMPRNAQSFRLNSVELLSLLEQKGVIFLESFPRSKYDIVIKTALSFNLKQTAAFVGSVSILCEDLPEDKNHLTVIMAGGERAAKNLAQELNERNVYATYCDDENSVGTTGVYVITGQLTAGFEIPYAKFTLITHGRVVAPKHKSRHKKGTDISSLEELKIGDLVVHAAHGIGVFDGINQLTTRGITKDYIKIRYAGKDVLYVPVTSLDMVSRYIGAKEDSGVKIHKLGSAEWGKTRSRVRTAVKDIAKQLIILYAKRMQQPGFAFSPDGDLQADFERRFQFDETDDQLRCIEEIKQDMQQTIPMDRLLCGDVGFGKTEVALRAAFKCIVDGKQAAILVPTTILAWQHYNTAIERFGSMPVEVEMLSRFRTPKQQEKIKKDLKAGVIDLIIGTHRIISNDIKFHDIGLMIVDEEQRFGVAQKEKLKELHPNVDVLTLSATPIPRTLNMALSGLRDMSSIEEAPQDRKPVQTYVLEFDMGVIIEAMSKEIRRGGQVYYLHNRTDSIISTAAKLQKLLPDSKIAVAHGKMDEDELSRVWQQLLEHEIDVLVCTTIIETGVDVPNANTLIIEDADKMGLSQLHQLRGRVGRSHRRAFAYLFFKTGKVLSEISQKRLEAIKEYTEFGSGFKIAMRDLEIRGAGSVLGGEQHGHMEAVGYDMYLKMLSDAINVEKGETVSEEKDCIIEIRMGAHIPEKYITSMQQRIAAYKRIAGIRTDEDVLDVTDELIDRFGDVPEDVVDLMEVALLKSKASKHGISEISEQSGNILMYMSKIEQELVSKLVSNLPKRVMLNAGAKPYLAIKFSQSQRPLDALKEIISAAEER
ncbi:MAG: transcription-repair coupling factor, partial [Oscillospiraceae bacterium]|nr:transcription-repair coupling factor [Oscillospiraceae bacterium]